jgi:hypothetical protein
MPGSILRISALSIVFTPLLPSLDFFLGPPVQPEKGRKRQHSDHKHKPFCQFFFSRLYGGIDRKGY